MITPYLLYEDVAGAMRVPVKSVQLQEVGERNVGQKR